MKFYEKFRYKDSKLKFQWIFTLFAILLIILNVFLFIKFENIKDKVYKLHLNRFITFLNQVSNNYKNYLLKTLPKSDWVKYLATHKNKQKEIETILSLIVSNDIRYIYLLGIKNNKFIFLADGSKKDKAGFKETFLPLKKEEFLVKKPHYFFHTEIEGLYLTYINPIVYNKELKALIVIDVPLNFLEEMSKSLDILKKYILFIMSFIVLISIVIIYFAYLDYKREMENEYLNNELLKLNKELSKKIEEKLKEIREKDVLLLHQSKLASLGEMLNMIAHQWRQPLNALSAAAIKIELLENLGQMTKEDCIKFSKMVQENTQRLSEIINDFMKLGKHESRKEKFLMKEFLNKILDIVKVQLENHNIKLIIQSDDCECYTYKKELTHVLLNLISNARDALDENDIKEKYIKIEAHNIDGNKCIISVENPGEIPENIQQRLFEPYFTTKEESKGTGLGLYMSKKIIEELLKGKIYFEVKNKKTKFIIELKREEII